MGSYLVDWGLEDVEHKTRYFEALRLFVMELEVLATDKKNEDVKALLKKYNIYGVNNPDSLIEHRTNIDFPIREKK